MTVSAPLTDVLLAGLALVLTLGLGTVAHEGSHALVLYALGVPFDVSWLPDREGGLALGAGLSGKWASVTPRTLPADLPSWGLRVSALAPLALAAPMALVLAGVLPDPVGMGNLPLAAAALGWFGCALPSPRDFSLVWHAERAIEEHGSGGR